MNCQPDKSEQEAECNIPTSKEQDTKVWVAQIVEIPKAEKEVWIRVEWYYSPDDLQGGRQAYHGKYEIVRSTLQDVIPVDAVLGLSEVIHWDENHDTQRCLDALFW